MVERDHDSAPDSYISSVILLLCPSVICFKASMALPTPFSCPLIVLSYLQPFFVSRTLLASYALIPLIFSLTLLGALIFVPMSMPLAYLSETQHLSLHSFISQLSLFLPSLFLIFFRYHSFSISALHNFVSSSFSIAICTCLSTILIPFSFLPATPNRAGTNS